jgi:hypothetical protein
MLKFKEFVKVFGNSLLESKFASATSMRNEFADAFSRLFPNEMKPKGTKPKEAIRANFGAEPEENIRSLFGELNIQIQNIIKHDKGTIRDEKVLGSNDYDTYEIISTDNQTYYVTNRNASIGRKDLTPKDLNLEGPYTDKNVLIREVNSNVDNLRWIDEEIREFMKYLVEVTAKSKFAKKYPKMKDFFNVSTHTETINFDRDFEFDEKVIKNITNDFGEILDGVYLSTIISDLGEGVYFPPSSNELLQDLVVDLWSVSSKAEKVGGRPSIDGLVQRCKSYVEEMRAEGLEEEDPELKNLLSIFETLGNPEMRQGGRLKTVETYTLFAQKFNEIGALSSEGCFNYLMRTAEELKMSNFGKSGEPVSRKEIAELMSRVAKSGKWDSFIETYLRFGETKTANVPTAEDVNDIVGANKKIGIIMYPLSKEIVNILNKDYSSKLVELVNKVLSVKQMYLNIDIKKDNITYRSVTSDQIKKVTFEFRGSTNNFNQGLGFKMA